MDISFILIIAASAILISGMMVYAEVTRRRRSIFRLTFGVSYLLGLALMQPWQVTSPQEAGMSVMMLIFMAIWVVIGCIMGAVPTAIGITLFKWIKRVTVSRT